jgi:hypothetical protein
MKEQIQKHARKHIKGGCYLKVILGHRGLTDFSFKTGKQIENGCYNFQHQYKQGVTAKRRTYL